MKEIFKPSFWLLEILPEEVLSLHKTHLFGRKKTKKTTGFVDCEL